ncbi:zinc finger protein 32-like [Sphaeramia orbicularis]|uniref:zinc finger protein 32-like n=1 Tax=Sphaeramia orbicularis TaxID=375764 RepID=UPI00117F65E4|nr:zinc finger protein 32-like [Sphaeramia orbicularis]
MLKTEQLRALVNERLRAAAEEIFRLFEKSIQDYEEEVLRTKQELERQLRLKGPLQFSDQDKDVLSEPKLHEKKHQEDKESLDLHVKEEQEDVWTSDKAEEADTKDTMFNIIYVQRSDENQSSERDLLPSSSAECLKAELHEEGGGTSETTSDCQMSEDVDSDDEWTNNSGANRKKTPQTGETTERPHTCNICNKNFRIKSILTRHIKTHTGDKPYSCGVCGKSFIQRSYLQTHMNSHSGQKPHTCRLCGRGFTQVGNMNAHMRIHTGEKPHSCADCGKSFREKADLTKHMIIHTGEKPYGCSICSMKFSAQSNLARHMKTHSGERPHSCTVCGKRFIRRSHLIIHTKTHNMGDNL